MLNFKDIKDLLKQPQNLAINLEETTIKINHFSLSFHKKKKAQRLFHFFYSQKKKLN